MALDRGRFAGQVLTPAGTTAQRGMPSRTVAGAGGTGWTPLHLPGLQLWLDAADATTITSSAGAVSQWNDLSGLGRHVTQSTGANQPTTGTRTLNGLNALNFDGTTSFLQAATAADWTFLHNGTPHLVAVVVQADVTSGTRHVLSTANSTGGPGWQLRANGTAWSHLTRSSTWCLNEAASTVTTSRAIITIVADIDLAAAADRSALHINGGAAIRNNTASTAPSTANPNVPITVGLAPSLLGYWDGAIAEIVIASGVDQNDALRTQLLRYLNAKWACF